MDSLNPTNGQMEGFIPLEVAEFATSFNTVNLTAGTASNTTLPTTNKNVFKLKPATYLTGAIFVKYKTVAATGDASATNADEVLTPNEPTLSLRLPAGITAISLFSASAQTVYLITR